MVLYYALGGGLGHLVRARAVLELLGLSQRAAVLSASRFAEDRRVIGELPVVRVPSRLGHDRAAFRTWLADAITAVDPEELIVDSFPGGILGELCGMELPPSRHVARRLRWLAYARRLPAELPLFERTYVLEQLDGLHDRALLACSRQIQPLELSSASTDSGAPLHDGPHWLVVHSGPDEEVVELAAHASDLMADAGQEATIIVVCPQRPSSLPPNARWRDVHPAAPHFAHAERVFTAAGFNTVHELSALRARHHAIPFPRPLDDQYARARRAGAQNTIVRPSWAMTRSSR